MTETADLVQYTYLTIQPDGTETEGTATFPADGPTLETLEAVIRPLLNGGDLERVRVFWNDRYLDMFVDEIGMWKRLPKNPKATEIYHNNMRVHSPATYKAMVRTEVAPNIYGPAILFLEPVWS